jgi:hypothetical protein
MIIRWVSPVPSEMVKLLVPVACDHQRLLLHSKQKGPILTGPSL